MPISVNLEIFTVEEKLPKASECLDVNPVMVFDEDGEYLGIAGYYPKFQAGMGNRIYPKGLKGWLMPGDDEDYWELDAAYWCEVLQVKT